MGNQVFMREFYDSRNQVESISSSKLIILPKNLKNHLEIQRVLIFRCQRYSHQTFKLFDLNEDFQKLT